MRLDPDGIEDPQVRVRLSSLMAAVTDADHARYEPPDDLWGGIDRRIAHDRSHVVVRDAPPRVVADLDAERSRRAAPRRAARRRPRLVAPVAAAIVLVAVGVIAVVRSTPPEERVVAQAQLQQVEPLGATSASARLVTKDGVTRLVVVAENMPPAPPGESYELWLIDGELGDPRSLGVVTGSGEVTVPPSIDPRTHPVVDISLEPADGDRHHSGRSLMRGTLH
jgi:hypothetical protein